MTTIAVISQLPEKKHPVNKSKPPSPQYVRGQDAEECVVSGMLAMVLRISRVLGMAPLQMRRVRGGWCVHVSNATARYSSLLMFTLHAIIITTGIMDMALPPEQSVRGRTLTAQVLFVVEIIIMLLMNALSVHRWQSRMTEMIMQINVIEQIKSTTSKTRVDANEKRGCYMIAGYLVFVAALEVVDIFIFIDEARRRGRNLTVACMYIVAYIEEFMMMVFELQFITLALRMGTAFSAINSTLKELTHLMDMQLKSKLYNLSVDSIEQCMISVPPSSVAIGNVVDTMTALDVIGNKAAYTSRGACASIRRLVKSYGTACDVMRQVNKTYGPMLLLLVGSMLIHLIQSPYYFIVFLYQSNNPIVNIVLQVLFLLWFIIYMLLAIEPGQRTYDKIEKTKVLVGQLLRRVTSQQDPLVRELDLFITQIAFNRVEYAPLGVCVLTRPFIATIFGGVTTYLVIILQFQTM